MPVTGDRKPSVKRAVVVASTAASDGYCHGLSTPRPALTKPSTGEKPAAVEMTEWSTRRPCSSADGPEYYIISPIDSNVITFYVTRETARGCGLNLPVEIIWQILISLAHGSVECSGCALKHGTTPRGGLICPDRLRASSIRWANPVRQRLGSV
jgi:hypothetical protein